MVPCASAQMFTLWYNCLLINICKITIAQYELSSGDVHITIMSLSILWKWTETSMPAEVHSLLRVAWIWYIYQLSRLTRPHKGGFSLECVLKVKTQSSGVKFEIQKPGNVSPHGQKKIIFLRVENSNSLLHLTSCFLMTFLKRLSVWWGGGTDCRKKHL